MKDSRTFDQYFTALAKHILSRSGTEARRFHHPYVDPEHLLLALLSVPESVQRLQGLAVDVASLRMEVEKLCQKKEVPEEQIVDSVGLTPRLKGVIQRAVKEAHQFDQSNPLIDNVLLLFGILTENEGGASTLLMQAGVTPESLRTLWRQLATFTSRAAQATLSEAERTQKNRQLRQNYRDAMLSIVVFTLFVASVVVISNALGGGVFQLLARLIGAIASSPLLATQPIQGWLPLRVAAYFLVLGVFLTLLFLPLFYLATYFFPRRYGMLPTKSSLSWLLSWFRKVGIFLATWLCYTESLFLLHALSPTCWWSWSAGAFFLFRATVAYIAPLFGSSPFSHMYPCTQEALCTMFTVLTERASTNVHGLYVMEKKNSQWVTPANAYAMGWGRTQRIVLTGTLVKHFPHEEIESIIAHELGHHVHHDFWKKLGSKSLCVLVILFLFSQWLPSLRNMLTDSLIFLARPIQIVALLNSSDYWYCFAEMYLVVCCAFFLYRSYSRHLEYLADEYEMQLTGNVPAFKRLHRRLVEINARGRGQMLYRSPVSTHPSLQERLEHADTFAKQHTVEGNPRN